MTRMASHAWKTGAWIALVIAVGLAAPTRADIVFPAKEDAGQSDAAYKADNDKFLKMVADCEAKAPSFKELIEGKVNPSLVDKSPQGGIKKDTKNHIDVRVVRSGDFIDNAESRGGKGKITVNIANLERLPDSEIGPDGKPKPPPGTSWGMTRCELIAHFLKEADVMAKTSATTPTGDPHDRGRDAQNDVRKAFKQFSENPCRSSVLPNPGEGVDKVHPKEITYKDKDGKSHTTTPSNQVQINYGGQDMEVLWFDKDGHLQMAFFKGNKQVPREELTLPGDDPSKKKINPDYVYGPSTNPGVGTLAAAAINADCTDPETSVHDKKPAPPPAKCSHGGGLAGAMNDVACQIQHG